MAIPGVPYTSFMACNSFPKSPATAPKNEPFSTQADNNDSGLIPRDLQIKRDQKFLTSRPGSPLDGLGNLSSTCGDVDTTGLSSRDLQIKRVSKIDLEGNAEMLDPIESATQGDNDLSSGLVTRELQIKNDSDLTTLPGANIDIADVVSNADPFLSSFMGHSNSYDGSDESSGNYGGLDVPITNDELPKGDWTDLPLYDVGFPNMYTRIDALMVGFTFKDLDHRAENLYREKIRRIGYRRGWLYYVSVAQSQNGVCIAFELQSARVFDDRYHHETYAFRLWFETTDGPSDPRFIVNEVEHLSQAINRLSALMLKDSFSFDPVEPVADMTKLWVRKESTGMPIRLISKYKGGCARNLTNIDVVEPYFDLRNTIALIGECSGRPAEIVQCDMAYDECGDVWRPIYHVRRKGCLTPYWKERISREGGIIAAEELVIETLNTSSSLVEVCTTNEQNDFDFTMVDQPRSLSFSLIEKILDELRDIRVSLAENKEDKLGRSGVSDYKDWYESLVYSNYIITTILVCATTLSAGWKRKQAFAISRVLGFGIVNVISVFLGYTLTMAIIDRLDDNKTPLKSRVPGYCYLRLVPHAGHLGAYPFWKDVLKEVGPHDNTRLGVEFGAVWHIKARPGLVMVSDLISLANKNPSAEFLGQRVGGHGWFYRFNDQGCLENTLIKANYFTALSLVLSSTIYAAIKCPYVPGFSTLFGYGLINFLGLFGGYSVTMALIDVIGAPRYPMKSYVPGYCYLRLVPEARHLGPFPRWADVLAEVRLTTNVDLGISSGPVWHIHTRPKGVNVRDLLSTVTGDSPILQERVGYSNGVVGSFCCCFGCMCAWLLGAPVYLDKDGYCYHVFFSSGANLGPWPKLKDVISEYKKRGDRNGFVTQIGYGLHATRQPLHPNSICISDIDPHIHKHLMNKRVGGFKCAVLKTSVILTLWGWCLDKIGRHFLSDKIGYCYLTISKIPLVWLYLGAWPQAFYVQQILSCDITYAVSNITGAYHLDLGGPDTCTTVFQKLDENPYWIVGGETLPQVVNYSHFRCYFLGFLMYLTLGLFATFPKWLPMILDQLVVFKNYTISRRPPTRRNGGFWLSATSVFDGITAFEELPRFSLQFLDDLIVYLPIIVTIILSPFILALLNSHFYVTFLMVVVFVSRRKGWTIMPVQHFYTCGTTGDNLPIRRISDFLADKGFETQVRELINPEYARENLSILEEGAGLAASPSMALAVRRFDSYFDPDSISYTPWTISTGNRSISYTLAPAAYARGSFKVANNTNLINVLVNLIVNYGAVTQPSVGVGDFLGWLPRLRAADDIVNKSPTGKALVSMGSSSIQIRGEVLEKVLAATQGLTVHTDNEAIARKWGWVYISDVNHDRFFQDYDVICNHGGAGTMQTALSCRGNTDTPCKAVSLSNNLDREWHAEPAIYKHDPFSIISQLASFHGSRVWFESGWVLLSNKKYREFLRLVSKVFCELNLSITLFVWAWDMIGSDGLIGRYITACYHRDLYSMFSVLSSSMSFLACVSQMLPPDTLFTLVLLVFYYGGQALLKVPSSRNAFKCLTLGPCLVMLHILAYETISSIITFISPHVFEATGVFGSAFRLSKGKVNVALRAPVIAGCVLPIPYQVCFMTDNEIIRWSYQLKKFVISTLNEEDFMLKDICFPLPFSEDLLTLFLDGYNNNKDISLMDAYKHGFDILAEYYHTLNQKAKDDMTRGFSFATGTIISLTTTGLWLGQGALLLTWGFVAGVMMLFGFLCLKCLMVGLIVCHEVEQAIELVPDIHQCIKNKGDRIQKKIFERSFYETPHLTEPSVNVALSDLHYGAARQIEAAKLRMSFIGDKTGTVLDWVNTVGNPFKSNAGKREKTAWAPPDYTFERPVLYNGRLGTFVARDPVFRMLPLDACLEERFAILNKYRSRKSNPLLQKDITTRKILHKTTARDFAHLVGDDAVADGMDGMAFSCKEVNIASLREYTYPKNKHNIDGTRLQTIAEIIVDNCPDKFFGAELADPVVVAREYIKKQKYSAGLDFESVGIKKRSDIRKGGYFRSLIEAGMRPFKDGEFRPGLFHAFPKSQVVARDKIEKDPMKIRTITSTTGADNITQGVLCMDLNKRKPDYDCWSKAGVPAIGTFSNAIFTRMEKRKYLYSLDGRAFDRNLNDALIRVGTLVQKIAYRDHPSSDIIDKWLDCAEMSKRYGYIVNLVNDELDQVRDRMGERDKASFDKVPEVMWDEVKKITKEIVCFDKHYPGGYIVKVGGGATGDYNVTFTNTIACQAFVIDSVTQQLRIPVKDFHIYCDFANVSDDNMLGSDLPLDIESLVAIAKDRHGIDLKVESTGSDILGQTFLAKKPEPAINYKDEFEEAGVEMPRFAILHDRERLERSIGQTKIADERKQKLSTPAKKRWEIERLCGLMGNCAHHHDLFDKLGSEALAVLKTIPRKYRRGLPDIPSYGSLLKNFYSVKRVEDFQKVTQLHFRYPLEELIHDDVYKNTQVVTNFCRGLEFGHLGEFGEYLAPEAETTPGFFEPFMWLCFRRENDRKPNVAELDNMCKKSAFSAFCNASAWMERYDDVFGAMNDSDRLTNLHRETWLMIIYTMSYSITSKGVAALNLFPVTRILGYLVQLYRFDLPNLFAAGSHLHFLGTGRPSAGLSKLVPKDRHHYIKRASIVVARILPCPKWLGLLPVNDTTKLIAKILNFLGDHSQLSLTTDVATDPVINDGPWLQAAARITDLLRTDMTVSVSSPCGSGKTRYLPDALLKPSLSCQTLPWKRVMVVMPRRVLCAEYIARKRAKWKKMGESSLTTHMTCTYGYIGHVISDGLPDWFSDTLFVFDEAHERSADWLYVFSKIEGKVKSVLMTATTLPWMKTFKHIDVLVETPFEVTEEKPQMRDYVSEFVHRSRQGKQRILLIHPSKKQGLKICSSLQSMGFEVTTLSADTPLIPKTGHVIATSIADASLTIPGCDCVIDTGLSIVNQTGRAQTVTYDLATKIQRKGRTGRTNEGTYITFCDPVDKVYGVCPSIEHLLCGSHYLEMFDVTVTLDINPEMSSVNNKYLFFRNPIDRLNMVDAELYSLVANMSAMTGSKIQDEFNKFILNEEFCIRWLRDHKIDRMPNFLLAKSAFETTKPYYKNGLLEGAQVIYMNKILTVDIMEKHNGKPDSKNRVKGKPTAKHKSQKG